MLTAGTTVAGYRIERLIGEGGMAAVYEAHQESLDRVVALKILTGRVGGDAAFRERFRRECHIQARLDHPNIVPVYEAGESDYGLWLTMRLVRGPTLRELLLDGKMSTDRTLELLRPIAGALDAAHEHGLIHRDITPQNILVDGRGHPYLADFGITKSRGDRSLTRTGQFVGTLDYVAPEQIQDEPASAATDVYSFAAILFECLTGRVPFDKQTEAAVLYAHIADAPPRATELDHSLPVAIDDVLGTGLAKTPADRQPSAAALIDAASVALAGSAGEAAPSPAQRTPAASAPSIDRSLATMTGARPSPPEPAAAPASPVPRAPAQDRRSRAATRRMGLRRLVRPLPLSGFLVLCLGGLAVGATAGDGSDPSTPTRASAGPLVVELPDGWSARRGGAGIPGLPLADRLTVSPEGSPGGGSVVVGVSGATGESLLPRRFARDARAGSRSEPVSLGSLEALRYDGLEPRGPRQPTTVFASPATVGVATLACRQPAAEAAAFLEICSRVAASLELSRGRGYPLGPSPALASVLRRRISTLRERRSSLRRRLGGVRTAAGQAAASSSLAKAYRDTARPLASLEVTPQSAAGLAAVVAALRSARDAYDGMAAAARREDGAAYEDAANRVDGAEASLDERLRALRELGYPVGRGLRAPGKQETGGDAKGDGEAR